MTGANQEPTHGHSEPATQAQSPSDDGVDRRSFISASTAAMGAGLVAGYGTFGMLAGSYLYPTATKFAWTFVGVAQEIAPGDSYSFQSPGGLKIVITRKAESPLNQSPPTDDFLALSSTCPHLGCRVHWEPHNGRFFCPCHNGEFDPSGNATGGPPKDAHQHLPTYPLQVDGSGLLYIGLPPETVGNHDNQIALAPTAPAAAGDAGEARNV